MSWFDEQIRERINNDENMFSDAYADMVNNISGKKIAYAFRSDKEITKRALAEILSYYQAKESEMMQRRVKLTGKWYKDAYGAMLARKTDGSTIALIPNSCGGYHYNDYGTGETIRITRKNAAGIKEEAVCFYPPFPFKKMQAFDLVKYTYNPPIMIKFNGAFTLAVTSIGTMIMYYYSIHSGVSVSDYMAFISAYGLVNGAFTALLSAALQAAEIKPMMEMVKPILETEPETVKQKSVITHLSGSLELNNVSFRYDESMPYVLNNVSLKIRSGQYVAIVGKTGCGKSTLMRLLLGFEKPEKGAVYYDGRDLATLDLKSLRSKIGVVMQNEKIFQDDIFSNIKISAPKLSMEDAWEAVRLAGLEDEIRAMPMGMYTMLSEGQGGISGGQRQRLLIARAIAPKSKILMFDEATSALDNVTQRNISRSLEQLKCTRIVIAHRLSTIKNCDRIIVLEEGQIIEDGTYEQLMEKEGAFAELVRKQQLLD